MSDMFSRDKVTKAAKAMMKASYVEELEDDVGRLLKEKSEVMKENERLKASEASLATGFKDQQVRIEAALALHHDQSGVCGECVDGEEFQMVWPCPTVKALRGEP